MEKRTRGCGGGAEAKSNKFNDVKRFTTLLSTAVENTSKEARWGGGEGGGCGLQLDSCKLTFAYFIAVSRKILPHFCKTFAILFSLSS